jgi:hypothetical protein
MKKSLQLKSPSNSQERVEDGHSPEERFNSIKCIDIYIHSLLFKSDPSYQSLLNNEKRKEGKRKREHTNYTNTLHIYSKKIDKNEVNIRTPQSVSRKPSAPF